MRFGFLVTAHCNASCRHCTVNSGPHQTLALSTEKTMALMDQAAAIWRKERARGERLLFSFSGGEVLLDLPKALQLFRHGAGLGADISCVTNGSWASNDERARSVVADVKAAGLKTLAVSTSRFHQQFVKRERVQRALSLARAAGLEVVLKCAVTTGDRADPDGLEQWARTREVDDLEVFPVLPYLRQGESLPESDYLRDKGLPRGRCPAATLTVREDGRAYTCCMPGGFNALLSLGSVHDQPLQKIYDRFYLGGVQQALRHRGPIYLARAINTKGEGRRLRERYESVCDLCAHMASDPVMARIALSAGRRFGREQLRAEAARHLKPAIVAREAT